MSIVFVSMNYSSFSNWIGQFYQMKRKSNLSGESGFVVRICARWIYIDLFIYIKNQRDATWQYVY